MKVVINLTSDADVLVDGFSSAKVHTSKEYKLKNPLFGYTSIRITQGQYFEQVKVELFGENLSSLHMNGNLVESILLIYL